MKAKNTTSKAPQIYINSPKNNKISPKRTTLNITRPKSKRLTKTKISFNKIITSSLLNISGRRNKPVSICLRIVPERSVISKLSKKLSKTSQLPKRNYMKRRFQLMILSLEKALAKEDSVLLTWQSIRQQALFLPWRKSKSKSSNKISLSINSFCK